MNVSEHLPILVVLIPLLGGMLTLFAGPGRGSWAWACVVTVLTFAASVQLLGDVLDSPGVPIDYALGAWDPPWGIALRIDALSAIVLVVVSGIGAIVTFASRRSVIAEIGADRHHFFYTLWLLAITGLLGITATGDAFNVYVLLEISSLTSYALIAMGKGRDRRALPAAMQYLLLGSIGASFLLIGIGYLYMATGTLNMADMHERLLALRAEGEPSRTVETAFAFILVGLGLKMALFPLHLWLPNAYAYAPSAVSALLAATATKVGIYMAYRFTYTVFATDFGLLSPANTLVLLVCASLAVLFGSLVAARQSTLARLLAYSSVAHIGTIVLGLAVADRMTVTGSILHIFSHAMTKGGLFLAVGVITWRLGANDLRGIEGLGRRMPWTMAAIVVGGLGLIGIPGTAGFVSKLYIVRGMLVTGHWALGAVVLVGSVLAAVYFWRVVEAAYFRQPNERTARATDGPWTMLAPLWLLTGLSVWFGLHAADAIRVAEVAADSLVGGRG